jgi:hypothetical protein
LVLTAVAYFQPVTRSGLGDILGRNISRDVIAALRSAGFVATGPRSPQPGAPHTYVTTAAFLALLGLASLRDLPDLDRLEEAGLLGKPPLPEELRAALGITDDDEDPAIAADEYVHPETGFFPNGLVIRGWQRAGAWSALFGAGLGGTDFPRPEVIYAADPRLLPRSAARISKVLLAGAA